MLPKCWIAAPTVFAAASCSSDIAISEMGLERLRNRDPQTWAFEATPLDCRCLQASQSLRSLVRGRHFFSRRLRRQMQVNDYIEVIPDHGIEIPRRAHVFTVCRVWRFRQRRSHQKRSRALRAAIVLTPTTRRLAAFILNHRRLYVLTTALTSWG